MDVVVKLFVQVFRSRSSFGKYRVLCPANLAALMWYPFVGLCLIYSRICSQMILVGSPPTCKKHPANPRFLAVDHHSGRRKKRREPDLLSISELSSVYFHTFRFRDRPLKCFFSEALNMSDMDNTPLIAADQPFEPIPTPAGSCTLSVMKV